MAHQVLTAAEMAEADRLTIAAGPLDGFGLMLRAGAAVADAVLARFPGASRVHVLCGPGNNGGDGYVVAQRLAEAGVDVCVWASGPPRPGSDAAIARERCTVAVRPLAEFAAEPGSLVIDALYGAGLARPLDAVAAAIVDRVTRLALRVVAVDLPSGVSGDSGQVLGSSFRAVVTITFARKKPGHLLQPGRFLCGEVVLADIGIPDAVVEAVGSHTAENDPALWLAKLPVPDVDTHKYKRGHVGVFSGGPSATGAARLSAMAAARGGAGAVTLLSPANALQVNASHLTSIILRKTESIEDVEAFLEERRPAALVFGPGLGAQDKVGDFGLKLIGACAGRVRHIVFDADALTVLGRRSAAFVEAARAPGAPGLVLTPHTGEFGRLFPDLAGDETLSKLDRARKAAAETGATVILKGPDTVIAAADGRAAINANGTPLLATAGSGDVLAGLIAGLLAQGMPAFEAACAAVWLHAEAARRFGPGLIAEDLPVALPSVLRDIFRRRESHSEP